MSARRLSGCGILLIAWLMATGAAGACPFFKPTTPEPPRGTAIIPDYSSPTLTLQTLALGLVDKNGNNGQDVYMGAFADSSAGSVGDGRAYHAFFDLRDLVVHPNWNRDWNKELEPFVFNSLVQTYNLPFEMTWEPYYPAGNEGGGGGGNDSLLHRKYRIVQVARNGNTITRSPLAVGAADLQFVRSQRDPNKWVIAIWQDYHTVDADSLLVTLGKRRLETQGR